MIADLERIYQREKAAASICHLALSAAVVGGYLIPGARVPALPPLRSAGRCGLRTR